MDDLYRTAIRLHQQGKVADAGDLYERILAINPEHAGALHLKGVLALQAGDAEAAISLIERSLAIEPRHRIAKRNEGAPAVGPLNLKQVTSPEILDRHDLANLGARFIDTGQPDQIGVIIFALFERRELSSIDFD